MLDTKLTREDIGAHSLHDYEAPFAEYLGAKFDDAMALNPVPSLHRWWSLREAQHGRTEFLPDESVADPIFTTPPRTPKVPVARANEIGKEYGLTFDYEPTEEALEMMIRRKEGEIHRRQIIERSNVGVTGAALGFLTELAATAVDPVNIASAFIPIAGPGTRLGGLAARAGSKTGERAIRGAIEGAVGAALVEPIVLGAAFAEQADYTEFDSFMNVVFGSALGGGLHVVGGKVIDWADKLDRRVHNIALQEAVADLEAGRAPNVVPLLEADPSWFRAKHRGTNKEAHAAVTEMIKARVGPMPGEVGYIPSEAWVAPPKPKSPGVPRPKSLNEALASAGGVRDTRGELAALDLKRNTALVRKKGRDLDYAREWAQERGYFGPDLEDLDTTPADLLDLMDADARGNRVYSRDDAEAADAWADYDEMLSQWERRMADAESLDEITPDLPADIKDMALDIYARYGGDLEDALEDAVMQFDHRPGRVLEGGELEPDVPFPVEPRQRFDWKKVLKDRASAADDVRNDRLADFAAVERKDEIVAKPAADDLEGIRAEMEELNDGLTAMALEDPELRAELEGAWRESMDQITIAEKRGAAVDAFASCMARG